MRLGFVGVGRWAQKLATAFHACGAEIVAYDRREVRPWMDNVVPNRKLGDSEPWFGGHYHPWRDQLADSRIDAIVAVATPEVTTEVALACAAAGKPVMATKPLFDHPERISAPFYVDFWRLWSRAHEQVRREFQAGDGANLSIALYGSGPFRSFPGAFDYGPHVLAAMLDIAPDYKLDLMTKETCERGELINITARVGQRSIGATFGNGSKHADRMIGAGQYHFEEHDTRIGAEEKSAVLQRFCQSFLDDIADGFVDPRLLNLSRDGMRELRKIREMATQS